MYPTEQPTARADLLSRVISAPTTGSRRIEIMGAGHPRLSFELDAFSTNQPAHYSVDDDYVRRKGHIEGFNLWLTGQLAAARTAFVALVVGTLGFAERRRCIRNSRSTTATHVIIRWTIAAGIVAWPDPAIPPGSLRLQTDHLLILQATATCSIRVRRALCPNAANEFVKRGAAQCRGRRRFEREHCKMDADTSIRLGRPLVHEGTGRPRSGAALYAMRPTAEWAISPLPSRRSSAIESLSLYLGDATRIRAPLDALFKTVEDNGKFNPAQFAAAAKPLLAVL